MEECIIHSPFRMSPLEAFKIAWRAASPIFTCSRTTYSDDDDDDDDDDNDADDEWSE